MAGSLNSRNITGTGGASLAGLGSGHGSGGVAVGGAISSQSGASGILPGISGGPTFKLPSGSGMGTPSSAPQITAVPRVLPTTSTPASVGVTHTSVGAAPISVAPTLPGGSDKVQSKLPPPSPNTAAKVTKGTLTQWVGLMGRTSRMYEWVLFMYMEVVCVFRNAFLYLATPIFIPILL